MHTPPKAWPLLLLLVSGCSPTQGKDEPTDTDPANTDDTAAEEPADSADPGLLPPEGDPATVELAGACPMAADHGGFVVEVDLDYSIVDGAVLDAVVPTSVLTPVLAAGDCSLLRRENPFCDPVCESGFTCSLESECVPFPAEQDLGTVTVAGLAADVVMEPRDPGARYFDTSLPHPAVQQGELVELRTEAAGTLGELVLHGVGPAPLEVLDEELVVIGGQSLELHWTPPAADARTHVELFLNIDQHGATPMRVSCVFADTGTGTIDGTIIEGLVSGGVTGFPSARLRRQTVDHTTVGEQCLDFGVASPRFVEVRVDGFTPCDSPDDCPEGQTCNLALEICE